MSGVGFNREKEAKFHLASIFANTGRKLNDAEIQQLRQYHSCSMSCPYSHSTPGLLFEYKDKRWRATGEVWVCKESTCIHYCGVSCREKVECPEGSVCTMTGACLDQAVSLARSGKDVDVRVCGDISYVQGNYGFHAGDTQDNVDEAQEHVVADAELSEFAKDKFAEHFQTELGDVDGRSLAGFDDYSGCSDGDSFEAILDRTHVDISFFYKHFMQNRSDVDHVVSMYKDSTAREIMLKIGERVEWRKQAEHAWKVRALGVEYMRWLESQALMASEEFLYWLREYLLECNAKGKRSDIMEVCTKYIQDVIPKYKGVFFGDVVSLNEANKLYFVECMLNIWERYLLMPKIAESRIRFNDCCTAILSKLQSGYSISIYMVEGSAKPRQSASLTLREQRSAREVKVCLIDAHPELYLMASEVVREVQNKLTRERYAGRDTTALESNCWTGPTINPGRKQQVTNRQRASAQKANCVPPLKLLHTVFAMIVENVQTLDELYSFSLSSIKRQHTATSQVRRTVGS